MKPFPVTREVLTLGAALLFTAACSGEPTGEGDDGMGASGGTAGTSGATAGLGGASGAAGSAFGGSSGASGSAGLSGGTAGGGAGSGGAAGGALGGSGGSAATGGVAASGGAAPTGGSSGTFAGQGGNAGFSGASGAGAGGVNETGGTAGVSGSAGMGGSAGVGGSGGSSGNAGTGGTAGTAGAAGSSGSGGSGQCQKPSAPAEMQETIDLTWTEMTGGFQGETGARPTSASVTNFRNTILDQIMETGGTLNYCVRWESTATVSAALRDQIAAALTRGVNEWFSKLVGYDCWPYTQIPVKVVGWATRDRNTLDWTDTSIPIYVNDIRENAPQCAEACGRFFHQQAGYTYPQCQGGEANHYDMSLWLTAGMNGGAGGDWGQRVGSEYFTNSVNNEHQHIWLHEFGHGFGFPDYYNWSEWVPGVDVPNSVMVAGLASLVTDWDQWMLRHTYSNLKSRF